MCRYSSHKPSAAVRPSGSGPGDETSGGSQPCDHLLAGNQWNVAHWRRRGDLNRYDVRRCTVFSWQGSNTKLHAKILQRYANAAQFCWLTQIMLICTYFPSFFARLNLLYFRAASETRCRHNATQPSPLESSSKDSQIHANRGHRTTYLSCLQ